MRIREIARPRPRFGYLRIWVVRRREGWMINTKRVRRLYRLEGLQLRLRVRRRKHTALHRGPAPQPARPTERWSIDFVHDALANGRPFRGLTVVDQWSRQSPILDDDETAGLTSRGTLSVSSHGKRTDAQMRRVQRRPAVDHIGIDLHKRESQIYVLCDTGEVTECRVMTSRERFAAVLGGRPPAKILLEASTESEWVATCLEGLGHEVIVADPNYAPMYGSRTRAIKTDRRDAAALAEACRIGAYRAVHRVSAAQRQVRQQLRVRETLVATRRRVIAMVRALCRGEGIRLRGGAAEHFLHRLAEVMLPPSLADTFAPVLALLSNLEDQLAIADRTIAEVAAHDVAVQRLMSVPGVGPIIGTAFVAALDTPTRFSRGRQVASYLGLVPREDSSAERRHRGHITKAGNPRMRWLLVQAAWTIRLSRHKRAAALRDWANHLASRRGTRIAVVALARRLAGILYALWRDGTLFDARRLQSAGA